MNSHVISRKGSSSTDMVGRLGWTQSQVKITSVFVSLAGSWAVGCGKTLTDQKEEGEFARRIHLFSGQFLMRSDFIWRVCRVYVGFMSPLSPLCPHCRRHELMSP